MTEEELRKEATEYALEWGDKTDGTYACCRDGYLAGAEPREKRIEELEDKLANADYQLEGRDIKIKELEAQNKNLQEMLQATRETRVNADYLKKIAELEAQIEEMKCCINDLVHLGEFNEHTDEEYFNYQVHEALKNAEQFIKEIKEND